MKVQYIFLLSALAIFSSCSNDDELRNGDVNEVALFLSSSISTETFGVNALISESATLEESATGGRTAICEYTDAGEFSVSSDPSATVALSYGYTYDVSVNCNENQFPISLNIGFDYAGNFDGPELIWTHEGTGDFVVAPQATEDLIYNGTYNRNGSFDLKNFDRSGSSDVSITLSNVVVSSEDNTILSGSGTFSINVTRSQRSYQAEGTITFNGDDTASLEFNDNTFTFNIINGEQTR